MTNSDIISAIRSANKFVQDDDLISDRMVYFLAKRKASVLLRREINQRRLLNSDNVYQNMECLELIPVQGTDCDLSGTVRRSKNPLPQIEEGHYSYFIEGVFNPDNSQEIYPTTKRSFINQQSLRIKSPKTYYLIKDRYLYVLNPDVEMVNIYAYFTESINDSPCTHMYDREFKFPPYLLDSLIELCNQSLINYHKLGEDSEDNNTDQPA